MESPRRNLLAGAAAVFVSATLVAASPSLGAVTLGSDLSVKGEIIDHNCSPGVGCTVLQTALPGRELTAPFSGLVVRWRELGYGAGSASLRVVSLLSSSGPPWTTSFLRSSDTEPTGGLGVVAFPISPPLPIAAGDTIAVTGSDDIIRGTLGAPGATDTIFAEASPQDGTIVTSTSIKGTNDDWLYNADIVGPPTSTAVVARCPGGSGATVTVTADPDPATGPKAVHFKIDGGATQTAATTGSPGVAAVPVPPGVHGLEFWGEDLLGQQETTHHVASAGCGPLSSVPAALPHPSIAHLAESHRIWRAGSALASTSGTRPPIGTTFSFTLNEQARVELTFVQAAAGRRVNGRCVAQTKGNRLYHACKRSINRGVFAFTGHPGTNKVAFQGRISRSHKLKPGSYTAVVTAVDVAKAAAAPARLAFTIVR